MSFLGRSYPVVNLGQPYVSVHSGHANPGFTGGPVIVLPLSTPLSAFDATSQFPYPGQGVPPPGVEEQPAGAMSVGPPMMWMR